jgi:CIC family chloride channel protein
MGRENGRLGPGHPLRAVRRRRRGGGGAGLGAVAFRYLIYFFTWLATGHVLFGQQGHVGSSHLPWLGLAFSVVIPVIGGLIYGPLIYRYAAKPAGMGCPR